MKVLIVNLIIAFAIINVEARDIGSRALPGTGSFTVNTPDGEKTIPAMFRGDGAILLYEDNGNEYFYSSYDYIELDRLNNSGSLPGFDTPHFMASKLVPSELKKSDDIAKQLLGTWFVDPKYLGSLGACEFIGRKIGDNRMPECFIDISTNEIRQRYKALDGVTVTAQIGSKELIVTNSNGSIDIVIAYNYTIDDSTTPSQINLIRTTKGGKTLSFPGICTVEDGILWLAVAFDGVNPAKRPDNFRTGRFYPDNPADKTVIRGERNAQKSAGDPAVIPNVITSGGEPYKDKNGYFEVSPPDEWVKKEFNDPRSKVSFDVPAPVAGQNKAGLFFLSHPLSQDIDLKTEAEDRVARLKQMGSPDAKATTVEFAGVKAERVEGQMGRQNMLLRAFMFTNYGRSYTVQYSATRQDFDTYWAAAETALKTFRCIPPAGTDITTPTAQVHIDAEKIRVWVTALKEQDLGTDAMQSLLAAGESARPQLEEAAKTGTSLQKERATRILSTFGGTNATSPTWATLVLNILDEADAARFKQMASLQMNMFGTPANDVLGQNVAVLEKKWSMAAIQKKHGKPDKVESATRDENGSKVDVQRYTYGSFILETLKDNDAVSWMYAPCGDWAKGIRDAADEAIRKAK